MIGKIAIGLGALVAAGLALTVGSGTAHAESGGAAPPAPGSIDPNNPPADLLKIIQQAKDTANPAVLLNTADMLDRMQPPLTAQANDLRALAKEISAITGTPAVPVPSPTPPAGVPQTILPAPAAPPPPPIIPSPAQLPPQVPIVLSPLVVTATPDDPGKAMAASLTSMLQGVKRRGAENKALVGAFQQQELDKGTYTPLAQQFLDKRPTVADQLYGAATAILVSSYGIVPVRPFYWSSDPVKANKQKAMFTALMLEKAATDPTRSTEWAAASNVANS